MCPRLLRITLALCAGSAAMITTVNSAQACSCFGVIRVKPVDGELAPTNTRVWVDEGYELLSNWTQLCGDAAPPLLEGPGGAVETTLQRLGDAGVLTPLAALEPATTYTFTLDCPDYTLGLSQQFTTGAGPDTEAPPLVEAVQGELVYWGDTGTCASSHFAEFSLVNEGIFTIIDVHGDAQVDLEAAPPEDLGDPSTLDEVAWSTEEVIVGRDSCSSNWKEADFGERAEVRFATFDLAGNFSGWTAAELVDIPAPDEDETKGCSAGAPLGPAGAFILGLGFLALGLVRRR